MQFRLMWVTLAALCLPGLGAAQDLPPQFPAKDFQKLHALIKPQAEEFAWYDDIPWLIGIQEAREKAASGGKPIIVWCSADGQPCGAT